MSIMFFTEIAFLIFPTAVLAVLVVAVQPLHPGIGTMLCPATVKFICRHKKPCTPSLAAAVGTTACIAVAVPSVAAITRGT